MNGRWFFRAALVLVLAAGATLLGVGAYQAGLAAGLAADGAAAAPVAGYGWYPGGFGFGFLGFLGTLLFFFLVFGLLRAAFWGGPRRWSDGDRRHRWEGRAHDAFEAWHREAHGDRPTPRPDAGPSSGSTLGPG